MSGELTHSAETREREREKRVRERDNYYINNANRRMKRERSLHVNKRVPREGDRVGKSERGGGKRFCVWDARCVCLLSDGGTKEVVTRAIIKT